MAFFAAGAKENARRSGLSEDCREERVLPGSNENLAD